MMEMKGGDMKVTIVFPNTQLAADWSKGRVTLSDADGIYFDSGERNQTVNEADVSFDYPLPEIRKGSTLTVSIFSLQSSAPALVYLDNSSEFAMQRIGGG